MSENELAFASIEKMAALLSRRKISPVELAELALRRIERAQPKLNAFITVTAERALADARRAEREILGGRYRGPLHGLPIALKDNIATRGVLTTAGSKILREWIPEEDATVARRLSRAGAVLLGKTNLHEFAYGVTTDNPHYGAAHNPWSLERIPGGSSGGSGAALGAGLCFGSVGTDTGGSIRIPAALCGVVGLKPTYGRVSCFGVVPLARSLDHAGPLARSVRDAALLLQAIAGHDSRDPASARAPVPEYLGGGRRKRIRVSLGVERGYFFDRLDDEIRRALEAATKEFARLGATMEEITLPSLAASERPSSAIAFAEALAYHEGAGYFPARAAEYGDDVRARLAAGREVRAADYLRAFDARRQAIAEFETAFERVDAILAPTVPAAAPRIGETSVEFGSEQETVRAAMLRLNRPANFTGLPAISLPCGFTRSGLPIGLQLIGPAWQEERLLEIALCYEQATPWHTRHPSLD